MIGKGLLSSIELRQYLLETMVYPREAELLKELRTVTETDHPLYYYGTEPDAGQLLGLLLEIINPKKTIEIGVFTGYSLLLTALAIPKDGKIIAIDPDQEAYDVGLPVIKKSGVEHKINFINSKAHPVLDNLLQKPEEEGTFDFAFVDADKDNYASYHEKLLKLVKPGGLIVYDNTLWMGTVAMPEEKINEKMFGPNPGAWATPRAVALLKDGAVQVKEFNKMIAADSRVTISLLASGDGMTICRKI